MTPEVKRIVHPAGELIDFETVFEENTGLARKAEKQGHFERVEYTTDAYGDGAETFFMDLDGRVIELPLENLDRLKNYDHRCQNNRQKD